MNNREINTLASLLHDIGKFTFRAYELSKGSDHETLGQGLIANTMRNFAIFATDNDIKSLKDGIKRTHQYMVSADSTVSKEREPEATSGTRRPLISVFSDIQIEINNNSRKKSERPKDIYYYNPATNINSPQKPKKAKAGIENLSNWRLDEKDIIEKHRLVYEDFLKDISSLESIDDYRCFFTSLYSLLSNYLGYICSAAYKSRPDISLFDHSRLVAAIYLCKLDTSNSQEECLLIKGDISGIQNFIYKDIKESHRAVRQLRGRSYYVKLLSESISNYLIEEFDIYECNILFASGGNFVIIVPNTKNNRDKVLNTTKGINLELHKQFGGTLQLVTAQIETGADELMTKPGETLESLDKSLYREKKRKSISILPELMLEPQVTDYSDTENERLFITLGGLLPKSRLLIEYVLEDGNKYSEIKDSISFNSLKLQYSLKDNFDNLEYELSIIEPLNIKRIIINNLNYPSKEFYSSVDSIIKKYTHLKIGYSHKSTGSWIPMVNDKPLDFTELSLVSLPNEKVELDKNQYSMLGFARMDIDNLGKIFIKGLTQGTKDTSSDSNSDKYGKLSKLAFMSREIDAFFTKRIIGIAEKYSIYLVYSGGDDLFAVGRWKNIIRFAQAVRDEFSDYMCNNRNITLSCGISFSHPSYPLARAAEDSGKCEKQSKDYQSADFGINKGEKSNITLFDRTIKFERLAKLIELKNDIQSMIDSSGNEKSELSHSFLYKLLTQTKEIIDKRGRIKPEKLYKLKPMLHYQFARQKVVSKQIEQIEQNIQNGIQLEDSSGSFKEKIAWKFLQSPESERKLWYYEFQVPASYVIYENRKTE